MSMDGFGMGWGILMMAVGLLVTALVIAGVVWLVLRLVGDRQRPSGKGEGAIDILERRFAAGEIDADEYRERRSTLDRGG